MYFLPYAIYYPITQIHTFQSVHIFVLKDFVGTSRMV